MRACPHCGKELPEELQFCPYCMEKFIPETPVGTPARRRSLWWLWLLIVMLLLTGVLLWWLLWPRINAPDAHLAIPGAATTTKGDTTTTSGTTTENGSGVSSLSSTTTGNGVGSDTHTTTNQKPGGTTKSSGSTTKSSGETTKPSGSTTKTTGASAPSTTSSTGTPCADGHHWTDLMETVRHEEVGHYEQQEAGATRVTVYKCPICYQKHLRLEDYYIHFDTQHADSAPNINLFRDRYETDTQFQTVYEQIWVVDQEAYEESVVVGRLCSRCHTIERNKP